MVAQAIIILAVVSGVVQLLGYISYLQKTYRQEIEPDSTSWLMFAFETLVLLWLEKDFDAGELLFQPLVCTILGIWVAERIWREGNLKIWPKERLDQIVLVVNVILIVVYAFSKNASEVGRISQENLNALLVISLTVSNLSGVVSFIPIIRHTKQNPRKEHPTPWLIWGVSYLLLGIATYLKQGWFSYLMLYPAFNAVLHLAVGYLSLPSLRKSEERAPGI